MKLRETIKEYADKSPARFHMPGHKGTLHPLDITELGFSDDLHHPEGVIAQLQRRCADIYGADEAFLLINGSSSGVCAMLCALALKLNRSPRILAGRDCHKSLVSGAFFADAQVCGVYPDDEEYGTITPQAVENAFSLLYPAPDAVFITYPNYYGMCADIEKIYHIAKKHDAYLFVDCAHGAHFAFSDELPPLPPADAYCVSTHKTLSALNQTGLLFSASELAPYVKTALDMLQTTSPSYPLMVSIEDSMECDWKPHIRRIGLFRARLESMGIKTVGKGTSAAYADLTRLCILCDGLAASGYELGEYLESCGIFAEMCDLHCAVLITTPDDRDEWYDRLAFSLGKIRYDGAPSPQMTAVRSRAVGYTRVRAAMLAGGEDVPLSDAKGRVCAAAVGIYPPGTAYALPGEIITDDIVAALERNISAGGRLFGDKDGMIRTIRGWLTGQQGPKEG